jgi:hypothetical protein
VEEGGDGERKKEANLTLSILESSSLNGLCLWRCDFVLCVGS